MTTVNTLLDITDVTTSEPYPAFDAVDEETKELITDMRFASLTKGGRDLTLRIYGKTGSDLFTKYGDSFFFKPNDGELTNLLDLEKIADDDLEIPSNFKFRSAINKHHQLNIKLKKNGDDYYADVPFTPTTAPEAIVKGKECCIEVSPSFYFSMDGDQYYYGIFYRLESLTFNDKPAVKAKAKANAKK